MAKILMKKILLILFILFFLVLFIFTMNLYQQKEKLGLQNNELLNQLSIKKDTIQYEHIYYISYDDTLGGYIIPRASGLPSNTTCIWQYLGGNGSVPGKETTEEFHFLEDIFNSFFDLQIYCIDTNGKLYYGIKNEQR